MEEDDTEDSQAHLNSQQKEEVEEGASNGISVSLHFFEQFQVSLTNSSFAHIKAPVLQPEKVLGFSSLTLQHAKGQ